MITVLVRLILSGALLWFAYSETGPWTTVVLALWMFANELSAWNVRKLWEAVKFSHDILKQALRDR